MNRTTTSGFFAPRLAISFALCFAGALLAMMAWSSAAGTNPAEIAAKIAPEVMAEMAGGDSVSIARRKLPIVLGREHDRRHGGPCADRIARRPG